MLIAKSDPSNFSRKRDRKKTLEGAIEAYRRGARTAKVVAFCVRTRLGVAVNSDAGVRETTYASARTQNRVSRFAGDAWRRLVDRRSFGEAAPDARTGDLCGDAVDDVSFEASVELPLVAWLRRTPSCRRRPHEGGVTTGRLTELTRRSPLVDDELHPVGRAAPIAHRDLVPRALAVVLRPPTGLWDDGEPGGLDASLDAPREPVGTVDSLDGHAGAPAGRGRLPYPLVTQPGPRTSPLASGEQESARESEPGGTRNTGNEEPEWECGMGTSAQLLRARCAPAGIPIRHSHSRSLFPVFLLRRGAHAPDDPGVRPAGPGKLSFR